MADPRMAQGQQRPAPQGQRRQRQPQQGQQNQAAQLEQQIKSMPRPDLERLAMQAIMELQRGQQAQAQPQGQRSPQGGMAGGR